MCLPAPLLMAAQGAQAVQGMVNAGAADSANAKAYKQAANLANEQAADEYFQLSLRQATEASAASARIQEIEADATEGMGSAIAAAAEAGISGNTVVAVTQEFQRDQGQAIAMELRNKHLTEAQLQLEKESVHDKTKAAIFGQRPAPAKRPDLLGTLFTMGATAAKPGAWSRSEDPTTN